jgi:sec-independent protein translocase protein TatA
LFRNGLEPWHLIVVLVVVVLLFGSKKLPDLARGLGKSMRILKAETKALQEDGSAEHTTTAPAAATPAPPPPPPAQAQAQTPRPDPVPTTKEPHKRPD